MFVTECHLALAASVESQMDYEESIDRARRIFREKYYR